MRGKRGYDFVIREFARNLPAYFPLSVVQVKILGKFKVKPSKACISLWRKDIKQANELAGFAPNLVGLPILEQMSIIKAKIKRAEDLLKTLHGQIRATTYSIRRMRVKCAQLRRGETPV